MSHPADETPGTFYRDRQNDVGSLEIGGHNRESVSLDRLQANPGEAVLAQVTVIGDDRGMADCNPIPRSSSFAMLTTASQAASGSAGRVQPT